MNATPAAPAHPDAAAVEQAARVPHRWRNLLTLTGVTVVDNTESSVTSTIFPTIASALSLNTGALGVLTALGKIASVPTGPAWVGLSTRIGRKRTLILTTLCGGVFGIAAGFAPNFGMLLLFNTLMAASIIGGSPIANAVIADSFQDKDRARAAGIFYAVLNGVASFIGPAIALFTNLPDGWRYAMWTIGAICLLAGLIVAIGFRDPGVGAAEAELADLSEDKRTRRINLSGVLALFTIPTYTVMMISRLLSGHLLITVFGVTFLVTERGFSNATAALVLAPFGIGYIIGAVGGGFLVGWLDRVMPRQGRPLMIQSAQVFFAIVAFIATQVIHGSDIGIYCVFWGLMGIGQAVNVPVNRPIVAAVILPELRGQGFAIWLSVFETIGWALFSLLAGALAVSFGIQTVFLWVLVIVMLANAALLTALYFTYHRDVQKVTDVLTRRRTEAKASV
jgi:MFS family permease